MASAWGGSWGSVWGNSWGATASIQKPTGTGGGGSEHGNYSSLDDQHRLYARIRAEEEEILTVIIAAMRMIQ